MISRFKTHISDTYYLKYELPESFFDEYILNYLKDKCLKYIEEYKSEINSDNKSIAIGEDKVYHKLRVYFYTKFKLEPAKKCLWQIQNKLDFKFGSKKNKESISVNKIREEIKCWDLLGKPEREDGNRLWYKLRNERTASCCVYKETNSFYDFGDSRNSGDVIRLYQILNDCDFKTAIKNLSNSYD